MQVKQLFEWDQAKAESNLRKHDVRFETAIRIFADPLSITEQDRIVDGELRWRTLGTFDGVLLLVVAHTIDELYFHGETVELVRIISARKPSRRERALYENQDR
jgi:hypothetical protein